MNSIKDVLGRTETLTFDCYGTLIDWTAGLTRWLGEILGDLAATRQNELYEAYVRIEAEVEAEGYQSYRRVLTATSQRLAQRFGVELTSRQGALLAETLPDWPPFADTNEALVRLKQRYRLGVLSNIDRDLFAATARNFDVAFDFVITAQDVGSYKPALGHFQRLASEPGGCATVLHVAQSLYHDGLPAGELGLAFVWINRYNGLNDTQAKPIAEFPDLKSLAEMACGPN